MVDGVVTRSQQRPRPGATSDPLDPFVPTVEVQLQSGHADLEALLDRDSKVSTSAPASQRTVAVVDDDPAQLQLMHAVLQKLGLAALCIHQPMGATNAIARAMPSLIILDVNMPGIDGRDLCRLLRNDKRTRNVAVLFWSAMPKEDLERAVTEFGAAGYIEKGAPLKNVIAEVNKRLGKS
jgi:CheY-like chemotaxis protein